MTAKMILYISLLLPWFSLLFANKKRIKKYIPVIILTVFLMTIIFQIAFHYKWWIIHTYIVPWGYMIDVSFAYGLFPVGTFWIFYFTSSRFIIFTITNIIMDTLMAFAVLPGLSKLHIAEYKGIAPWQYFLIMYGLSFIIYGYYVWQQRIYKEDP
ncbi:MULTISPECIES: hypothetical protein [unclassified Niallia]|uniref:hypothetical protein n=1 Tax=unclassified Niallia TaxID=2837522 RepID=UPI001EDC885D|nr:MULTISPECIES: hypothetical protein [unclassified Niallia]MCM3031242.1 hypothetical protein [Niallia sp. MER 6]MDL0434820.1 hypothetical protein [Niallia sp. SS-2023]UPO89358.1 hypothetical protein L8T27_009505 [Niallia sp. Man26]